MSVPPLAVMRAMSLRMRCRLAARCSRTTGCGAGVEHDHRDLVGGRQRLGGGARRLLGQLHLGAGHRARPVDHQRQRQRRLLAPVRDVEPDGQHRFQARRHVAAGAEALRPARDQQPAALADEARPAPPASARGAAPAARRRARPDRSGRSRSRAAGRARRGRRRRCARRPARARTIPTRRGCLPGRGRADRARSRSPARPRRCVGWRSPPAAVARTCSVAVPGSVMRTVNVDGRGAGREREGLLRLVDRDVGVAGAVQADPRLGRRDRRAGGRRPGTACGRGCRRARVRATTATSPRSSDGQRRARTAACRDRAGARRPRADRRASGRRPRSRAGAGSRWRRPGPAPRPTASARSVAAPAGGGRRSTAALRGAPAGGSISSARAANRTTRGGGSPRSAAARRQRRRPPGSRTRARRRRRCRRRRPAPPPRRRAPAGASVGPASATADARQHQRPQQRLHAQLTARKIGERPAREQPERGHGEQRQQPRPGARTPAGRSPNSALTSSTCGGS